MGRRLENRNALVTGGSNGIGRAIALGLAEERANIVLTYRSDETAAQEVVRNVSKLGRTVKAVRCDFARHDDIDRAFDEALKALGHLDILVNNVGVLTRTSFVDITPEQFDYVITVNLRAPFFLSQKFAKHVIHRNSGGSIINISSLSSERARSRVSHYQSSKAALNMLTRSVAYELAPFGIRVNSISPGLTATQANRDQWESQTDVWQDRAQGIPLGRAGRPDDHVGAAIFLASDEAKWITGVNLVIDGGMSLF